LWMWYQEERWSTPMLPSSGHWHKSVSVANEFSQCNPTEILLQHDNARLHTSFKTQETTTQLGWTLLAQWT
jgi:hypothetical protein